MKSPLTAPPLPLTGVKLAPGGSDDETTVKVKVFDLSTSVALTWNLITFPASTLNDWQDELCGGRASEPPVADSAEHVTGTNI